MNKVVIGASTVIVIVAIVTAGICYTSYINRNKDHVYSAEELFAIECGKRGGNPFTQHGSDYSGDKSLQVQEFKCEVAK